MHRIYQNVFYCNIVLAASLFAQYTSTPVLAQCTIDTTPVSVNPALVEIFNSKIPKEYTIAGITVNGSKSI